MALRQALHRSLSLGTGTQRRSYSSTPLLLGGKKSKKRRNDPLLSQQSRDPEPRSWKQSAANPYTPPMTATLKKTSQSLFKYSPSDSSPELFLDGSLETSSSDQPSHSAQPSHEFTPAPLISRKKQAMSNNAPSIRQMRFQHAITDALSIILNSGRSK